MNFGWKIEEYPPNSGSACERKFPECVLQRKGCSGRCSVLDGPLVFHQCAFWFWWPQDATGSAIRQLRKFCFGHTSEELGEDSQDRFSRGLIVLFCCPILERDHRRTIEDYVFQLLAIMWSEKVRAPHRAKYFLIIAKVLHFAILMLKPSLLLSLQSHATPTIATENL